MKTTASSFDLTDRARLLDVARRCAQYICLRSPHIRMMAISGSLTRPEHRGRHEDADFFVVTTGGRIWEGFMACTWHGWRFSRKVGLPRTFFCFNYLVDEDHPEEIDLSRPEYVREFLRLELLHGQKYYVQLLDRLRERLVAVDPVLYERARRRMRAFADSSSPSREVTRSFGGPAHPLRLMFYHALRVPFIVAAKWMEFRRRRRYQGGLIYSTPRVVRSHLRRYWADAPVDPDGIPSSRAFTRVSGDYDQRVVASRANRHMRGAVWETLDALVRQGDRVLDLGAGTGVDAVWLARRGASVLAIDVSEGMVREASRRVEAEGMGDRVAVRRLAIESLQSLLPEHWRRYDLVLADFGALNLSGEPDRWAPVVARLIKPGGYLVANVMNRWSAWEMLAGLLRGRPSFALRRLRGEPIRIGDVPLPTRLYTPAGFTRRLGVYFRALSIRGLCIIAPPPALEHLGARPTWLRRILESLDRGVSGWPALRAVGDHFLVVMRQESKPISSYRTRGSITASPVVADVNGDGEPEIVIAADRLYVFDRRGRRVRGWPRRVGGPMASTPAIVAGGDGAAAYVGSDDDGLHALPLDGGPRGAFSFRTGGDVFSSPWVGRLEAGELAIAFGSDDGGVYAIDAKARPLPGWPVRTGGYVSASPVVAQLGRDRAVIIGSWDRKLHALAPDGVSHPGWPRTLDSPIWATAAVADVDGDGWAEVVAATHRLNVFRGDGSVAPGFPIRLGGYAVSSPAIGDLNGDGAPEIVVCADRVYAFHGDGSALDGFPVDVGAYIWASPILIDVDGDGSPEVLVGDFQGNLWALTARGTICPGYPMRLGARITAAATAADIDGDGYLELLVATSDGRLVILPTECFDDPLTAPWPEFRGRRDGPVPHLASPTASTGRGAGAPAPIRGHSEDLPPEPGEREHLRPGSVHLVPRVPMPFRVTEVHLDIPGDGQLEGGLLNYTLDGRVHPSPVLGGAGRYFALIQPIPPFKSVHFNLELTREGGGSMRLPEEGSFRMRVGVPGLRRKS